LLTDIISHSALRKDTLIELEDINPTRLNYTLKTLENYQKEHPNDLAGVKFTATTDQRKAIKDAKYVITSFLVGGPSIYQYDLDIPLKYGVTQCIGDSLGPGGVFRFLRSVPVFKSILTDMQAVGYNAGEKSGLKPLLLNYTNPMAMNTWYCNIIWPGSTVGLCHGVQGTADKLRQWVGVSSEEFSYLCAGINHMAWFIELRYRDRLVSNSAWTNAYPLIWEHFKEEPEIVQDEKLRWDMMKATGFFMTESSGHLSEYLPYYRKRQELIEKYAGDTKGFNNLVHGWDQKSYTEWQRKVNVQAEEEEILHIPYKIHPSAEYASGILNAMETDQPFTFNGNVLNSNGGLITNLPKECCVEVPITANYHGLHPQGGIELPTICQALCASNIFVQKAAVEAVLTCDREKLYHAILLDPNTASVLSPEEVRQMVDEMFIAEKQWLTWWK
jgi:alpha-galactosidase